MGKTVLEGRGHVRSGYVTAYHAVLMHWSCSNLPVPKEVQPSHRITTFGFHRLRMNVIRFHSSLYLQQRSKRSQELHMEKQQQTIKSFLLSALIFFSSLLQDRGCWSTTAPRGTRTVSRVTAVRSPLVQRPSSQTKTTTTACPATRAGLLLSAATAKRCKNNLIVKTFLWKIPEYTKLYHYRVQNYIFFSLPDNLNS